MTRAERLAQVQALLVKGLDQRQVAERLGISHSTVRNLLYDPDGSKQRERRKRYQGECIDCGAPTDGSNGRDAAPERCARCTNIHRKHWTAENVIDAIQRFAAEHGRPPTATDWRAADRKRDYPSATSVYDWEKAPFASWADAIEAAGFPRPLVGKREGDEWWDRERILVACRRWVAEHGRTPAQNHWSHSCDGHPNHRTVTYYFRTWNAMIVAAGFTPRRPGQKERSTQAVAA